MTGRRRRGAALLAVLVLAAAAGCHSDRHVSMPDRVVVAAAWNDADSADERGKFMSVLDRFTDQTGIPVTYAAPATRDQFATKLLADIGAGRPPDVALLAQPGLMRMLADCPGVLTALPDQVAETVRANYTDDWVRLGTVDDVLYGVVFKAANKSIVWYHPDVFRSAGVEPPRTWQEFLVSAATIRDWGEPAVAVAGATEWTLSDWFENVYLRLAGPAKYDQLADHKIPWTDPSVLSALTTLGQLWSQPNLLAGRPAEMTLEQSVDQVFRFNQAAAVFEGDFLTNQIGRIVGPARFGEDAKFFAFPSLNGSPPSVVAGGDTAVMTRNTPGGARLVQYLASAEAARTWAARGGLISPNTRLTQDAYPDPLSRQSAAALSDADVVRFDLSDLLPPEFGSTPGAGLLASLHDLLRHPREVAATANVLEVKAAAAAGRRPASCPA